MRSPLLIAFLNPLNLAILALSAVAGLCAAWWLFPIGVIVWGIMFLNVYRDPGLQYIQISKSRTPLTQRFQKVFDRIARSQMALYNNLVNAKPKFRASIQPLVDEVNRLTEQSYDIASRMTPLQNSYLVNKSSRDFKGELFNQKVKIENASDEITRKKYAESNTAIEEEYQNFQATEALLNRVEAQLTSVSSTIDNVLSDMLRLQALQPNEVAQQLPTLLQPLEEQSTQLSSFIQEAANSKI